MDDSLVVGEGVAIKDATSSPFRLTTTTSNHEPETLKFSLMSTGKQQHTNYSDQVFRPSIIVHLRSKMVWAALIRNMAIEVRFDTGHFLLISQYINSFNIKIDKFIISQSIQIQL